MTPITLTPEQKAVFDQLNDVTELWDKDGYFLGLFTPRPLAEKELEERHKKLFDLEEAERLLATEKEFRTTEQVLQHLRSLEKSK